MKSWKNETKSTLTNIWPILYCKNATSIVRGTHRHIRCSPNAYLTKLYAITVTILHLTACAAQVLRIHDDVVLNAWPRISKIVFNHESFSLLQRPLRRWYVMLHFDLQLPSSIKFQNLCLFQSLQSPNNSNKLKTSTESQYFNLELFNHASSSSFSIQFQSLPLAISSFTLLNSNKEFLCSLGNRWKPRVVEWSNLIYLTTKLLANFNGLLLGCIQTNLTQTKWSDLINLTLYLLAIPKGSVLGCILTDFCKYAGFSTRLASPPLTSSALTLNSSRSPSIFVVLSQSFSLFLALSLSLSLFIYLYISLSLNFGRSLAHRQSLFKSKTSENVQL